MGDSLVEKERKRIRKVAGLDPKPTGSYTSPGGFIKIPTPSGGPVRFTPPTPKVPKAGPGKKYTFPVAKYPKPK